MVGGRGPDQTMFDRVVRFGPCSAVVVSDQALVTSAHCLAFSVNEISTNGEIIPIAHPAYGVERSGVPQTSPRTSCWPRPRRGGSLRGVVRNRCDDEHERGERARAGRAVAQHHAMSAGRFCLEEGTFHGNEERARRGDG